MNKSRYSSQSTTNPYYFSYDYGFAHFLHFTTEFYYYPQFVSENRIADQFEFIKNDLKNAQENRKNVPWIIVTGHRPMYCQVWCDKCLRLYVNSLEVFCPSLKRPQRISPNPSPESRDKCPGTQI